VRKRVVVGFDGSDESRTAISWTIEEAAIRKTDLRIVAAVQGTPPAELWGVPTPARVTEQDLDRARQRAEEVLAELVPERPERTDVAAVHGHPGAVLIQESWDADLVVVGATGLGGFLKTILGSVSAAVVANAHCPVMIVH